MRKLDRMVQSIMERDPASINTDWDGTLLIEAMLEWSAAKRNREAEAFASRWFEQHSRAMNQWSNEEIHASYKGVKSRIVRKGPIPFSAYCGHWGLVYPMLKLSEGEAGEAARDVADAVADYIMHEASKSEHGCAYHDDEAAFLIPDTCYFTSPCLAIAAQVMGKEAYLEEAIRQLIAYSDLMQHPETGLAHTMWVPAGMPDNFWSRASGWLAGAYANTLRFLPPEHERYRFLCEHFDALIRGVTRVQRSDGGFHVLLDRPDTPTDCTAPAMLGLAMLRGVRYGLLDREFLPAAEAAWTAAMQYIDEDGRISGAYTGWAKTALEEQFGPDQYNEPRDFVTGLMLLAAAEFEGGDEYAYRLDA